MTETEERLRQVELEVTEIKAIATTLKWAAGFVLALLLTAFGFTSLYTIPASAKEAAETEAKKLTDAKLAQELPKLQGLAVKTVEQINLQKKQADDLVAKFQSEAIVRIGTLQLTAQCVQRSDNGCQPPPPAVCSAGFSDTGLILSSVVPGGPCGYGPICRVCSRIAPAS